MDATFLQHVWFGLFFVLIAGYAVLDGFDLGAGVLSLFTRADGERRLIVNALAPVWDGNEVWLLTGGGALFAAFPPVYATVFSGFYLALMLVLLGLIVRAVSMEFRGKVESAAWRRAWDWGFGVGSLLPALLFGVAVGNLLRGVPLTGDGEFAGTFWGLLNPFSLLVGVLGLVMFVTHGALYLAAKTEGDLRARMLAWASKGWMAWVALYVVVMVAGFFCAPARFEGRLQNPLMWVFFALFLGTLLLVPTQIKAHRPFRGLLLSAGAIVSLIGLGALSLYPYLVPALNDPALGLTLVKASSTPGTLLAMLVIALVGMPLVIGYTVVIYRVFRGPVVLDEHSY